MKQSLQKSQHYYQGRCEEMCMFLPEQYDKVLKVGCGEGNFTMKLKPGCEIWGVELNSDAAKIASKKMEKVLMGNLIKFMNSCQITILIW